MAEGLMVGICLGPETCRATGREAELALGPTMAWTRAASTSRRTRSKATSGSLVASTAKPSTGWPRTPPASLSCLMAKSKAFWRAWEASGESVKFRTRPILRWSSGEYESESSPQAMRLPMVRERRKRAKILDRTGSIVITGERIGMMIGGGGWSFNG